MKKFFLLFVAAEAIAVVSCQKGEINNPIDFGPVEITVKATADNLGYDTKTYLGEYNGVANSVLWGKDEQMTIAVLGESLTKASSTKTSEFEGINQATFSFTLTPSGNAPYVYSGVYPSSVVISNNSNAEKFKIDLPSTQNATPASYDPSAYIMIAKPESFSEIKSSWKASFRRATALNKITLKGLTEDIEKVEITAPEGQYLAGRRYIDLTTGASGEVYYGQTETITVNYSSNLIGGSDMDVWFTSWGQTIASGSSLVIKAYSSSHSYTRTISANSNGIKFLEGCLNMLSINMKAEDVVIESLETIVNESSKDNPYTTSEVIELAKKLGEKTLTDVYVKGTVSKVNEINTNYGNATYFISDDGLTDNQFEVYRGLYLEGASFTSADQLKVGDVVVICGTLAYYNQQTPEFTAGSKLVSLVRDETEYDISVIETANGTVSPSVPKALKGTEVSLTINPNAGYVLETLSVKDGNNNDVSLTEDFKFIMPASDVTVSASFVNVPTDYSTGFEVTEGFSAGTDYQSTVTQGPIGQQWEIFYGTTSTSSKISGDQSLALRLYNSDNFGYAKMLFDVPRVSVVSFKAKASTANSAKILLTIKQSVDGGQNWTEVEGFVNKELTSSAADYSFEVSGTPNYYRIQFCISENSTKPTKSNAQLTIDDLSILSSN